MSHPLMYVLGDTENKNFPLILTIGREPNYDDVIVDKIGLINLNEFRFMSGGVWVTAYTQIARQFIGKEATASQLKSMCLSKNCSPIVFTNAFPIGISNKIVDKDRIRVHHAKIISKHISLIFSKNLINRVKLVIHHGALNTPEGNIATQEIKKHCYERSIPYCTTAFFYNGNSKSIFKELTPYKEIIKNVFIQFKNLS